MSYQFGTNWSRSQRHRRQRHRPGAVLRGDDRLLPRGGIPRDHALWLEAGRREPALLRHLHGGAGHGDLRLLDPVHQQLDAHACRLRDRRRPLQRRSTGGRSIFNPSFPYRYVHSVLAAYLTTAFVVGGVGAWHLLRGHWDAPSRKMFSMAMWMAAIVAPIQAVAGDFHGLNTLHYQPAKIAAMEGHFEASQHGAPLYLFGLPDMAAENPLRHRDSQAGQPDPAHSWDAEIKGLRRSRATSGRMRRCCSGPSASWSGIGLAMIAIGAGLAGAALVRPAFTTSAGFSASAPGHRRSASSRSRSVGSPPSSAASPG